MQACRHQAVGCLQGRGRADRGLVTVTVTVTCKVLGRWVWGRHDPGGEGLGSLPQDHHRDESHVSSTCHHVPACPNHRPRHWGVSRKRVKDRAPPFPPCWLPRCNVLVRRVRQAECGAPAHPGLRPGPLAPTGSPESGRCLGLWSELSLSLGPPSQQPPRPLPQVPRLFQKPPSRPPNVVLGDALL